MRGQTLEEGKRKYFTFRFRRPGRNEGGAQMRLRRLRRSLRRDQVFWSVRKIGSRNGQAEFRGLCKDLEPSAARVDRSESEGNCAIKNNLQNLLE